MTFTPHNRKRTDGIPRKAMTVTEAADSPAPLVKPKRPVDLRDSIDLGTDTGALIASVPAMLGFIPENSMIFLILSTPTVRRGSAAHRSESSEVGPVVRADLERESVAAAADAIVRTVDQRVETAVITIVVGGDAGPLLAMACRRFRQADIRPTAAFIVTEMKAGALWWEISTDEEKTSHREQQSPDITWASGELSDPRESPVAVHKSGSSAPRIMDQDEFDGMLNPIPVPEDVKGGLPQSWLDIPEWEDAVSPIGAHVSDTEVKDDTFRDPVDSDCVEMCHLVNGFSADGEIDHFVRDPGTAALVARICDDARLFPALTVLATGPSAPAVLTLLTGVAQLARGLLRQRALALLSVAAWCGGGGVLAHRAAHLAVTEILQGPRPGWSRGTPRQLELNLHRAETTLSLGSDIVDFSERGNSGCAVDQLLNKGLDIIDRSLHRCPKDQKTTYSALLDRVLDRDDLNRVRSELVRRAGR